MKKVLFGIMAFSIAAFAVEPGNPGNSTGASVPVQVKAQVIAATDGLVITDMAGNILTEGLIIDHGIRVQGEKHDKSVQFKVKKLKTDGTYDTVLSVNENDNLTVSLSQPTTQLKHLTADDRLTSNLALAGGGQTYIENEAGVKAEHVGTITSTIQVAPTQKEGSYDNRANQDPMPVLKVVLGA